MEAVISILRPLATGLLLLASSSISMVAGQGGSGAVGGVLAKAVGSGNEVYGVYLMRFDDPTMVSLMRYHLVTKPKAGPGVNRAFLLAPFGRDEEPDLDRVLWMAYHYVHVSMPPSVFGADLTFDAQRNAFLIATLQSWGSQFVLAVHQVQLSGEPLIDPRQLDVERLETWPATPEALGSIRLSVDNPLECCVGRRINVVSADDNLIIHVLASGEGCHGMFVSFSMSGGGWKRLRIEPEDLESSN